MTYGLFAKSAHDEGNILPAESKTVGEGEVAASFAGGVGDVIEVAVGVGVLVVDRRRQNVIANREQADDRLRGPGGGNQVAHHALGAGARRADRAVAHHLSSRKG